MSLRPLDEFLPEHEFSERHSIAIAAPAERIDAALRAVSISDIPVARDQALQRAHPRAAAARRASEPSHEHLRASRRSSRARRPFVVEAGEIVKVFSPVFPPDRNADEVVAWLNERSKA